MPALIAPTDDAILAAAVTELSSILPFDAVQLLRHEPKHGEIHEVLRVGYASAEAWALQHLFTQKYRLGFTNALSPNDGLPPAISSVRAEVREDFVASPIFRDYLGAGGFRDGISMELFTGDRYVGIAHFSARAETGFTQQARRAAAGVRGMLAALTLGAAQSTLPEAPANSFALSLSSQEVPTWRVITDAHLGSEGTLTTLPSFLNSDAFLEHLQQFRESGLASVRHIWELPHEVARIEIRRIGLRGDVAISVAHAEPASFHPLSRQELRTMSLVCAGLSDAEIAARLRVSRRTVESHVLNARHKLGARNRVEAVVHMITTASVLPDPTLCPVDEVFGLAL